MSSRVPLVGNDGENDDDEGRERDRDGDERSGGRPLRGLHARRLVPTLHGGSVGDAGAGVKRRLLDHRHLTLMESIPDPADPQPCSTNAVCPVPLKCCSVQLRAGHSTNARRSRYHYGLAGCGPGPEVGTLGEFGLRRSAVSGSSRSRAVRTDTCSRAGSARAPPALVQLRRTYRVSAVRLAHGGRRSPRISVHTVKSRMLGSVGGLR